MQGAGSSGGDSRSLDDALFEENAALRDRVSLLELTLEEYRRQMDDVLGSVSWRVTSPFRIVAGRFRRLRTAPGRARRRRRAGRVPTAAPVTGLFAPPAPAVALASPTPRSVQHPDPPTSPRQRRVLVVAHVYYPELWHDIADRLARIPEPFDLVVTLTRGRGEVIEHDIRVRVPHAQLLYVENRGRDMLPLLEVVRRGAVDGYDAVLKVHTKRSPHRLDGDGWRIALLDGVLSSPKDVRRTIDLLRVDPDVGLVVPAGHVGGPEAWGGDLPVAAALAARLPLAFDPDALRFPAGSMYWTRPWLLRRLLDLGLTDEDFVVEAGHTDGTVAHALERFIGVMAAAAGLDLVETDEVASRLHQAVRTGSRRPRVVAHYLPQFHPIPENDRWWGEGFTDWRNVDRAEPQFLGHRQPDGPGELGRYDLRDPEVIRAQAALARSHGVDAFLFCHYWFDGQRLLDAPLESLLADPTIDLPFALCWANENWTRRWDGLDSEVLIAQHYEPGWAESFLKDIAPALEDPRYLRVAGAPLLAVYRLGQVPRAAEAIATWRAMARDLGHPGLHVLGYVPSPQFEPLSPEVEAAVDGLVSLPPAAGFGYQALTTAVPRLAAGFSGGVLSYEAATAASPGGTGAPHPGVMPGWDNTPRRGSAAWVFHGANPLTFRRWVRAAVRAESQRHGDGLVLVNAWNEWAEGAHLEPCARFGRGNLEAVLDAAGPVSVRSAQPVRSVRGPSDSPVEGG